MRSYFRGVFTVLIFWVLYKLFIFIFTVHVSVAQKTHLSVIQVQSNGVTACVVDPREYEGGIFNTPKSLVQVLGMRGDTAAVSYLSGDSKCQLGSVVFTPISLLRKAIDRENRSNKK